MNGDNTKRNKASHNRHPFQNHHRKAKKAEPSSAAETNSPSLEAPSNQQMENMILEALNEGAKDFSGLYDYLTNKGPAKKHEIGAALTKMEAGKRLIKGNEQYHIIANAKKIDGEVFLAPNGMTFVVQEDIKALMSRDEAKRYLPGEAVRARIVQEGKLWYAIVDELLEAKPWFAVGKLSEQGEHITIVERGFRARVSLEAPIPEKAGLWVSGNITRITDGRPGSFVIKNLRSIADDNLFGAESYIAKERWGLSENDAQGTGKTGNDIGRRDLRNMPFITIDGPSTRDIDDAVYATREGKSLRILVAIADVSHYVEKGSAVDTKAGELTSTSYLPHFVLPMIPRELSEEACSIKEGVERRVMVMDAVMKQGTEGWEVAEASFYPAFIKSQWRANYEQIDDIVEKQKAPSGEILNSVIALHEYAVSRTHNEIQLFDNTEINMRINTQGKVERLDKKSTRTPSYGLVESAMLLANEEAAKFLAAKGFGAGLFRNQMNPMEDILEEEWIDAGADERRTILKRALRPAFYDRENVGHYALQKTHYTHFTSPIRRFSDLMTHRLIKAALAEKPSPYGQREIKGITEHINAQGKRIKAASFKARNLLMTDYAQRFLGKSEEAEIIDVLPAGYVVRGINSMLDGFVPRREDEPYVKGDTLPIRVDSADVLTERYRLERERFELRPAKNDAKKIRR